MTPNPQITSSDNIFCQLNGTPLAIYVLGDLPGSSHNSLVVSPFDSPAAFHLHYRKNHGATICLDHKDASVVIFSGERKDFESDLHKFAIERKIVLDPLWVDKCVSEGHALLQEENYGGFLLEGFDVPLESDDSKRLTNTDQRYVVFASLFFLEWLFEIYSI